jgi:hypothetical protein
MKLLSEVHDPAIWCITALAAIALLASAGEARRSLRPAARALLLLAAVALLAGIAHPLLLPLRSAVTHADGSTDDPRVLSALLVGVAALAALAPAWRALRLAPMAAVGAVLPGLALAGLAGVIASFAGLRQPLALAGLALGAFGVATSVVLAIRARMAPAQPATALQVLGTSLLVIAAMLSLHGARTGALDLGEGAAADTLGLHVALVKVEVPSDRLRVFTMVVFDGRDSLTLRPRLEGARSGDVRSIADARWLAGPIAVPISLRERRANAHGVRWLDKGQSIDAGNASIRFKGFRIEQTDSIRMFADLEVTTAAGTNIVSPGVVATQHGELPFAAQARGFGPIAVAGIQADAGRVGLMLPQLAGEGVQRIALVDVRLRPALPLAWFGALLALLGFAFAFVGPAVRRP